ncbi:MAG: beta-lactamase family protein [bacterium]|nr:beta-lactamase family protein [bacterium]
MIARRVVSPIRILSLALSLACTTLFAAGCASGPPPRPANLAAGDLSYLKEYMTWYMHSSMDRLDLTGLSFALFNSEGPLWSGGLGYADREAGSIADENTIYMVASISKMITATAVMQLQESGKLNLDAPLRAAVPDFSIQSRFATNSPERPAGDGITLRNILSHHSGLPSDYLYGFYYRRPDAPADLGARFGRLPRLLSKEYVSAPPNRIFAYSNLGYSLAGVAVARAAMTPEQQRKQQQNRAGLVLQSFENYVQKRIFTPLRMHRSTFRSPESLPAAIRRERSYAAPYDGQARVPAPRLRDTPAGGLYSSAADLGKFTRMLLRRGIGPGESGGSQRVLGEASVRGMLRSQNASPLDGDFRIGVGLFLDPREVPGDLSVGHGGDLPPFHGAILFSPARGLGAVVLTNSNSSSGEMRKIAAEFVRAAIEARTGQKPPARRGLAPPVAEAALEPPCEICKHYTAYAGEYAAASGILRVLHERDDPNRLDLEIQGSRLEMIPRTDGSFSVRYRLWSLIPLDLPALRSMRVRFLRDPESGEDMIGIYAEDVPVTLGARRPASSIGLSPAWLARLGSYRVCNRVPGGRRYELLRNIKLVYDPEHRMLKLASVATVLKPDAMILALHRLGDQEAVVYGLGRHQGDSLRVEDRPADSADGTAANQRRDILWYSGFRLCPSGG